MQFCVCRVVVEHARPHPQTRRDVVDRGRHDEARFARVGGTLGPRRAGLARRADRGDRHAESDRAAVGAHDVAASEATIEPSPVF